MTISEITTQEVEALARALRKIFAAAPEKLVEWDKSYNNRRQYWIRKAREVIAAIDAELVEK